MCWPLSERSAIQAYAACPPASTRPASNSVTATAPGQGDGGGNAGPAATDDGDAHRVSPDPGLAASHSLRIGGSEMRWCSTRKFRP